LEAAGGGLEASLDSKKFNWFKLVDDDTHFFLSADGLGHFPTVTSLVTDFFIIIFLFLFF